MTIVSTMRDRLGYSVSIFMGAARHQDLIRKDFPAATLLHQSDLVREAFHSPAMPRECFSVMADYWASDDFARERPLMLDEWNRYAGVQFARKIDREPVVMGIQARIADALLTKRPDFILFSETPHNVTRLPILFLARWLKIPVLFFQPTSPIAPALLPRTSLDTFVAGFQGSLQPGRDNALVKASNFAHETAVTFLNRLEREGETLMQREKRAESRQIPQSRQATAGIGRKVMVSPWTRFSREKKTTQELWDSIMQRFRSELVHKYQNLPDDVDDKSFALFAMHHQPERTSVPEGPEFAQFQGDLIARARQFLPDHITLVVKEHESQVSPSNTGERGRSSRLYDLVNAFPNTKLINGSRSSRDQMSRSVCTFTITGSIGIESALHGVPCVYFGRPWWSGMPNTYFFRTDSTWEEFEETAIQSPDQVKDFLISRIREDAVPGFGTPGQKRFWSRHLDIPSDFEEGFALSVVRMVELFVQRHAAETRDVRNPE